MMDLNISTKAIFLFLSVFFSTIVLSMDLSITCRQNSIILSNDKIEEKKSMLGLFFGSLPTEVLYYSFKKSTPAMRNGLHQTNTIFSALFSWDNVHDCMLCKELIAHPNDIQSLIVRFMHKPDKSNNEKAFIESYQKRFFSYQILGEPRFFVLEYDNEKKPDLYLYDYVSRKKKSIHPLLEVCLSRNSAMVKDYLNSIDYKMFNLKKGLSFNIFRDAIQILIQNNDEASLALLLNSHKIGKKYIESAIIPSYSKFIQAALVVCVKPEIMQHMIRFYKIKNVSAMSTATAHKEEDWIAKMLETNLTLVGEKTKKNYLYNIIKSYHPLFECIHQDKKSNYHDNLRLLFNETTLKKLGIFKKKEEETLSESNMPNIQIQHENKDNNQEESENKLSHNKCVIM